ITATSVVVVAVRVADEPIAGFEPRTAEGLPRPVPLLPIVGRDRVGLDPQLPDLPVGHGLLVLVHNLGRVAGQELPAGAWPGAAGPVLDVYVAELGRTDAVQDLKPEAGLPAIIDGRWKGFTSRDASTHGRELQLQAPGLVLTQHEIVERGHREEDGRTVALD